MNNNVKLYPIYQVAVHFIVWMPVFFLYFSELVSLKQVVFLEAIYYISVVILEVPSGYFSDAIGRRATLIISAMALFLACGFYLVGNSFWVLAIAQVCFACWMAFQSGTNTVFYYESLKDAKLQSEYGDREAAVNKYVMLGSGLAALIGGIAGTYNLAWPYAITLIAALTAIVITFLFKEPSRTANEQAKTIFNQLKQTIGYLKTAPFGWLFSYMTIIYVIAHIPYEFYQPYLQLLENQTLTSGMEAPLISGFIYALAMFIGALAAGKSMAITRRFGFVNVLVFSLLFMLAIVGLLGIYLHPILISIILFRSVPRALIKAPLHALITPKIGAGQRATFYSIISLIGRLSFFACLFLLSWFIPKNQLTDWPTISKLFIICLGIGVILCVPLLALLKRNSTKLKL